jgi:hypothetical protein
MSHETPAVTKVLDLEVEDLVVEELNEATGAASFSTVGTVSTPASFGTAACLG